MDKAEGTFLDKIISNIPDSSPVDVWGNDYEWKIKRNGIPTPLKTSLL